MQRFLAYAQRFVAEYDAHFPRIIDLIVRPRRRGRFRSPHGNIKGFKVMYRVNGFLKTLPGNIINGAHRGFLQLEVRRECRASAEKKPRGPHAVTQSENRSHVEGASHIVKYYVQWRFWQGLVFFD